MNILIQIVTDGEEPQFAYIPYEKIEEFRKAFAKRGCNIYVQLVETLTDPDNLPGFYAAEDY